MPTLGLSVEDRFWNKVNKTPSCWPWTSTLNNFGYGFYKINGKVRQAHRLVYEWIIGPIPDGACVLHTCDVRHCVNPTHLFLGDRNDNRQDAVNKDRTKGTYKRLNYEDATDIRKLYGNRNFNQPQLAEMYGVGLTSINRIIREVTYAPNP